MKTLLLLAAMALTPASTDEPIDESAKVIQDEIYFLASQGIAIWQKESAEGDVYWISLHDLRSTDDKLALSGRVRGYHKGNQNVPFRMSISTIGVNCATGQIGVANWRTYSAKGKMLADRAGNVKAGAPYSWEMINLIPTELCSDGKVRQF